MNLSPRDSTGRLSPSAAGRARLPFPSIVYSVLAPSYPCLQNAAAALLFPFYLQGSARYNARGEYPHAARHGVKFSTLYMEASRLPCRRRARRRICVRRSAACRGQRISGRSAEAVVAVVLHYLYYCCRYLRQSIPP